LILTDGTFDVAIFYIDITFLSGHTDQRLQPSTDGTEDPGGGVDQSAGARGGCSSGSVWR